MSRPYVICHMTMTIDGKVTGDFLSRPECMDGIEGYYEINRDFCADAFACGRVTMDESFVSGWALDLSAFQGQTVARTDYVAPTDAGRYAVAFDSKGRLSWNSNRIQDEDPGYGGSHIIEVLCEDVSDAYLAYLRSIEVSYIFAGKSEIDLNLALQKLYELFRIKKLLLEGGSELNGSFHKADLIDTLSLVVVPVTGREEDKPLFAGHGYAGYQLLQVDKLNRGNVWMCYKRVRD